MGDKDKEKNSVNIFFPHYVNQSRLLDVYAIINGGYSEYSEITSTLNTEKTKKGAVEGSLLVDLNCSILAVVFLVKQKLQKDNQTQAQKKRNKR